VNDAANAALEILQALNRHAARCAQCRVNQDWCETALQYRQNFKEEFRGWANRRREAARESTV
jgi:hypothetical protein